MTIKKLVGLGIVVVLVHLLITTPHSIAHTQLQIQMNSWQNIYIFAVILLAPIISAILLWIRPKAGFTLLAISMAGSLLFGLYYHFIAAGPDNVAQVHTHPWASTFQISAVLLAVTELAGVVVGLRGVIRTGSSPTVK